MLFYNGIIVFNFIGLDRMTRKRLVQNLDKVFSEYIRRKDTNFHGETECYTCGKRDHWKKLQCGHFQSRRHYSTRWSIDNCKVQCSACNVFRAGEQYKFGLRLNKENGKDFTEKISEQARQIVKFSDDDLREKIKYFKNLIQSMD